VNITERQRKELETALDQMYLECGDVLSIRAKGLYVRASAIVRDRPAGQRKVRSDFDTKRVDKRQGDCVGDGAVEGVA
jgi:hypothetical protein